MDTPTKRGFFGPMKTLESAEYGIEELPGGGVRAWIRHEDMAGVSPAMLRWWFEHIDETTTYDGEGFDGAPVPNYRLWHPYDHIAVRWLRRVEGAEGRLAPGSVAEIREVLGARYPIRAKARVTKFDDEAFNFDLLLPGGLRGGELLHEYRAVEGGCAFATEMRIESRVPWLAPLLNRAARRFQASDDLLRTWIQHNVEESGETEKFVPALYAHAHPEGVAA